MRVRGASAIALLTCLAAAPTAQRGFEGIWSLDAARSSTLPPGMEQKMTITRDGERLHVSTSIVTDFGDRVQEDLYVFDGVPHDTQTPGIGSGQRTTRSGGPRSFSSTDQLEAPNGSTTIERAWSLSSDEQELTIELVSTGFGGRTEVRRIFTRGDHPSAATPSGSRFFPVDLTVPVPPTVFHQAGRAQLVYELHLHNFRNGEIEWIRLDVMDDSGLVLDSHEGLDLQSILTRPGTPPGLQQPQRIGGGMTAVAYLWIGLDGEPPKTLRHRAFFTLPAASSAAARIVESTSVPVGPPAVVIGPPARGRAWVARWVSNTSFHRRGLFPIDGRAGIAQRFAIDWNRYDDKGVEQSGDASDNSTYSVYGQEVIAVADATVAKVIDGVPQNSPPNIAPGVGLDPDKALGNCIVLELPGGLFATYAHMQTGSIQVKAGDRVHRGQLLGRVGNSGNATGPHLHFHIATGPGLQGEGVPYVIDSLTQLGAEKPGDQSFEWDGAQAQETPVHDELPTEHSVVAFP